ncbi:hypothetical protein BaRGS_00000090 [Batillaria attramentaria]|uniref:Uncharacterized protein n=1 Tax=Batillaria attramentaria TaxID=370345 RepID=A0ABD0MB31_9CAEN
MACGCVDVGNTHLGATVLAVVCFRDEPLFGDSPFLEYLPEKGVSWLGKAVSQLTSDTGCNVLYSELHRLGVMGRTAAICQTGRHRSQDRSKFKSLE